MRIRLIIVAALILILTPWSLKAQDTATYAKYNAAELLNIILKSSSNTERVIVSSYLVKKYPTSDEGLFASAVLAGYEGREDEEKQLYQKCLAQNPKFLPALYSLAGKLKGKDSIDTLKEILNQDPSWQSYDALISTYFVYIDDLKDKAAADAFLSQWEQKLPGNYVFDFIRAYYADRYDKDYKKAEQLYLQAMEKAPDDFLPYRNLLKLRFDTISSKTDLEEINVLLKRMEAYQNNNKTASEAYLYVGDVLSAHIKILGYNYSQAQEFYLKAYERDHTAENAIKVYRAKLDVIEWDEPLQRVLELQKDAYDFLLRANKDLPGNQLILNVLGEHASEVLGDSELAAGYYQQARKYSYTVKDETENALSLAQNVYESLNLNYDKAAELYRAYLDKGDKNVLNFYLFVNRRNAQDFQGALKYLDDMENYNRAKYNEDFDTGSFLDRRIQIEKYILAKKQVEDFYKENPFLKYWQDKFGDSLRLTINFAQGSAEIPQDDCPSLDQIGKLLLEQGANKYIFSIEGHSDNTETDKTLSVRRAESVRKYLETIQGISRERIRAAGYEDSIPYDSNDTPEGRAKNRRVEILPLGNISKPTISPTAALNADQTIALSPDGRTIATGNSPIQLWDVQKNIKLKDLGRGSADLKFSPNGRYLATTISFPEEVFYKTRPGALLIYDVKTGLTIGQVPWNYDISSFDWDPSSQKIVFTSEPNMMVIYDIHKKQNIKVKLTPGLLFNGGDKVVWMKDNRFIVVGRPWSKELQLFEPESLKLSKTLEGVDYPHALAQTKGGKYILSADNARMLTVWNTTDWSRRQMKIPTLTFQIGVHPERNIVVLNDGGLGDNISKEQNINVVVDLEQMAIVGQREIGSVEVENAFSSEGSKIYMASKDKIDILDAASKDLKPVSQITGLASRAIGSSTDRLNNYYISVDKSGVHVWNINTGKQVKSWDESVNIFTRMGDDNDNFLATTTNETEKTTKVTIFNTSKFESKEALTLPYKVDKVFVNSQIMAFAGKEFSRKFVGNPKGIIEVYDRQTLKRLKKIDVNFVTEQLEQRLCDSGFSGFQVGPSGDEALVATYWQDGFGHQLKYSRYAITYNLNDGKLVSAIPMSIEVKDVAYNEGSSDQIRIITNKGTAIVNKSASDDVKSDPLRVGEYRIHVNKTNMDIVWSSDYLRYRDSSGTMKQLNSQGDLKGVEVFEDKNLLITLNSSNEIALYNLSGLEKVLTILPKVNKEWIAYSPEGYYVSSINGTEKVFWSLGDTYLEFSTLASYEKPQVIAEALDSIFRGRAPSKVSSSLGLDEFTIPYTMSLISRTNLDTPNPTYVMEVRVDPVRNDLPKDLPEPTVTFSQNGRVYGPEGLTKEKVGNSIIFRREFKLIEGLPNTLQASLDYKQVKGGQTCTAFVNQKAVAQSKPTGDLWFLGIGVANYGLRYPPDDVECIANALKQQKGKLYNDVHVETVINQQAKDVTTIQQKLYEFFGKASSSDTIIIFISGHGVQYNNGVLFFIPYEGDLAKPYLGIPISTFGQYLDNRPQGQKAIFLMDICHAGAFQDQSNTSFQLKGQTSVNEARDALARGKGTFVLAATDGPESALEDCKFKNGHGAFAAAILEALDGTFDKDCNFLKNGVFSVNDLASYVSWRVPRMTGGRQHPTVPTVKGFTDYPLASCDAAQACPPRKGQSQGSPCGN